MATTKDLFVLAEAGILQRTGEHYIVRMTITIEAEDINGFLDKVNKLTNQPLVSKEAVVEHRLSLIKEEIRHICKISKIKFDDTLSEKFITNFKDKVDWDDISCSQTLSEEFIREFQDKVDWYYISHNEKLSENTIRKLIDKLNIEVIVQYNKVISEDFKKLLKVWS